MRAEVELGNDLPSSGQGGFTFKGKGSLDGMENSEDEGTRKCCACLKVKELSECRNSNETCNKCLNRNANYRKNNIDKVLAKKKEYRERKKDDIMEYNKATVRCDVCDCDVQRINVSRHNKTKKHIENLGMNEGD